MNNKVVNIIAFVLALIVIPLFIWLSPSHPAKPATIMLPIQPAGKPISKDSVEIVQSTAVPSSWQPAAYVRLEMKLPHPGDRQSISLVKDTVQQRAANYGCGVVNVVMTFVDPTTTPETLHLTGTCYYRAAL